jgi:hypothetical protein
MIREENDSELQMVFEFFFFFVNVVDAGVVSTL